MFGLYFCYNYISQLPHPSSDGAQEKATGHYIISVVNVIIIPGFYYHNGAFVHPTPHKRVILNLKHHSCVMQLL